MQENSPVTRRINVVTVATFGTLLGTAAGVEMLAVQPCLNRWIVGSNPGVISYTPETPCRLWGVGLLFCQPALYGEPGLNAGFRKSEGRAEPLKF